MTPFPGTSGHPVDDAPLVRFGVALEEVERCEWLRDGGVGGRAVRNGDTLLVVGSSVGDDSNGSPSRSDADTPCVTSHCPNGGRLLTGG